jgi:hypothetical protein
MSRATDVAWAAGFYEGEGTITCGSGGKNRPNAAWRMSVSQIHEEPIKRFHRIVGVGYRGGWRSSSSGRLAYVWAAAAENDIWHVITLLWPHLSERRRDQILDVVNRRQEYLDSRIVKMRPRKVAHVDRS